MKNSFHSIDSSIIQSLAQRPLRLKELLAAATVRIEALRLNVRRAGVSPSESADKTINERLQALRRNGNIGYDPATNRWEIFSDAAEANACPTATSEIRRAFRDSR